MREVSNNKENMESITYGIDLDIVEIGEYVFDLILANEGFLLNYLLKTDEEWEFRNALLLYQNEHGYNALEFAIINKKHEIASILIKTVYSNSIYDTEKI